MLAVKKFEEIHAAHLLPGYDGKCSSLHGHSWTIDVGIEGPVDLETGMVIDFSLVKEALAPTIESLDHHFLNDIIENPTAENIVIYVLGILDEWIKTYNNERKLPLNYLSLSLVRVWESRTSYAEWTN